MPIAPQDSRRRLAPIFVFASLLIGSCSAALGGDPATLARATRTVALTSLVLPEEIANPEPVQRDFEALLTEALGRAGFEVVPAREADAIETRLADSLGGLFDPVTGELDLGKREVVRAAARLELTRRFGARAVLRPSLEIVRVEWSRGKATWDGTSESVAPTGGGVVSCLSLVVSAEDSLGVEAILGRGGLQALAKASLWNNRWTMVPREKLFADSKRNAKAIQLALGPFAPREGKGR